MNRDNLPNILILCGLPGSGKSTQAESLLKANPGMVRINYDLLRIAMYGEKWKWNRAEEDAMKKRALQQARDALTAGLDVEIDNCNLNERARAPWVNLAKEFGLVPEIFEVDTPLEECVRRDRLRSGKARVGRAVIERMALFNGFIDWNDPKYSRDFIIVDMDGTIADCDHRRKAAFEGPTKHKLVRPPVTHLSAGTMCSLDGKVMDRECPECGGKADKNWGIFYQGVENDPPIVPIIDLVTRLHNDTLSLDGGYDIIIVSGRPTNEAGIGTEEWLAKNLPLSGVRHLFMRNAMDYRSDDIIKQEILDLLPKSRIKYVFDDRERVVAMWRRNGLTCLQVADGRF